MKGRIHRGFSATITIENLHELAEAMIGKPVKMWDIVVGHVISATVEGNYINWEAEDIQSSM